MSRTSSRTPNERSSTSLRRLLVTLIVTVASLPGALSGGVYHAIQSDGKILLATDTGLKVTPVSYRPAWTIPLPTSEDEIDQAIAWYARRYRLSPLLLRAVIQAESEFDPVAVSRAGALGLMQLMPETAASLRVRDPFNPVENIRGGAKQLRRLLDRFNGNLKLAVAGYNAGESRVRRYGDVPPIVETQVYVRKVLSYYRAYRAEARRTALPPRTT